MTWMLFWKIVFIAVLGLFAVMTVLTTINGAKDVRRLLKELDEEADSGDQTKR